MSQSFGPLAPHYDLLMRQVPYEMWVDYYRLLLVQIDAEPETLLDVCCGTGTAAEMLATHGFRVTGFDLSEAMIEEARRKAGERNLAIKYEVADVTTLDLGRDFDAAVSFFDSLNYVTTADGLRAAVSRVFAHLAPGAPFVFDLNTAYAFEKRMFDQSEQNRRAPIRYSWRGAYDPATRLIEVTMDFEREGAQFQEVHRQRAHSEEEIRASLAEAGFQGVRAFDSYTLDPPRKRSDRVHFVAIRP